jgi:hypothetical protein
MRLGQLLEVGDWIKANVGLNVTWPYLRQVRDDIVTSYEWYYWCLESKRHFCVIASQNDTRLSCVIYNDKGEEIDTPHYIS